MSQARVWRICAGKTLNLFRLVEGSLDVDLVKGKGVLGQFSHLVSVRNQWLSVAKGVETVKLPKGASAEQVLEGLERTMRQLANEIESAEESGKKACGFGAGTEAFVGYLCAHEAFHWAQVELALRQAGQPLDDKLVYGLWDWKVADWGGSG